jgi:renal tumor antigen
MSLGDYEDQGEIGRGNFSTVRKVEHRLTHEHYARKILTVPVTASSAQQCEEVLVMRALGSHPNVISLYDVLFDSSCGELSLIVDLMEENLYELMQTRCPFSPPEALTLVHHLLSALAHIHGKSFVHRDVKPENCFVNAQTLDLKLGDFGSMRSSPNGRPLTEYVATRWYRAPEVLLSAGAYGPAIDIWAVGCILAELLTGRPLFPGRDCADQLARIHRVLGSPTADDLQRLCGGEKAAMLAFQFTNPQKLENVVKEAPADVLALLSGLLAYLPDQRLTAAEALAHPALCRVANMRASQANPAARKARSLKGSSCLLRCEEIKLFLRCVEICSFVAM